MDEEIPASVLEAFKAAWNMRCWTGSVKFESTHLVEDSDSWRVAIEVRLPSD